LFRCVTGVFQVTKAADKEAAGEQDGGRRSHDLGFEASYPGHTAGKTQNRLNCGIRRMNGGHP
jgi:hypothetical protein